VPPHRELKERLEKLGLKNAHCTTFNGGHDYACWRGAIVPALERIIAAHREAERAERSLAEE
jgi:putative esterase